MVGRVRVRPLYGLLHHDPGVQAEARVRLPVPRGKVTTLNIVAEYPLNEGHQKVDVKLGEEHLGTLELEGGDGELAFSFPLNGLGERPDLQLSFSSENRFQREGQDVAWLMHRLSFA
ncbi:hypothetical protein JYT83_00175 [bacterium AH-315-F18]|nr:hypothetical protein [bacterium AH-315-F18]